MRHSTRFSLASAICASALSTFTLPGCLRAHAKTVAELPPLEMPAPPPRNVEVNDPEVPSPISLPGEPVRNTPPRPRPSQPRAESPRQTDQPKPAEQQPPVEAAKPPEESKPATPPATLQTTPTQREVEIERRVHTMVAQATNDLSRINYQALNADARTQYDAAKGFVRQAEEALKAKNLNFASSLADKAAALAAQLAGR